MDVAFVGGVFWTGEPDRNFEALLVRDGRIQHMGNNQEVLELMAADVEMIQLHGCMVVPGFVDAHTHFVPLGLMQRRLDLSSARSAEEVVEMLRDRVSDTERGRPIIAEGWDQSRWKVARYPTREELDQVAPDHPVVLRRVCGHVAVANTPALEAIGPEWREVDRETGVLLEDIALNLVRVFPPPLDELLEAVETAQSMAHRYGVTAVHDMTDAHYLRAYQELRRQGRLRVRVTGFLPDTELDRVEALGLMRGWGDDLLRLGGIKIFADGSLGARTAALFSPYEGEPQNRGLLIHTDWRLSHLIQRADAAGLQVVIHAIGDRAIQQVVDAYKTVLQGHENALRHRIEHLEMVTEKQADLMAELNLIASMQPNFVVEWSQPGGMYETYLGHERFQRNNPVRAVADRGVVVAFGSDCMPFSPLVGLSGAVEHPIEKSRVSVEEAITMYTSHGAYAGFDEVQGGSFEVGKRADLVVLSKDLRAPGALKTVQVDLTMVGGEIVYRRRHEA
jgi:predicted amidohydrolase YtcJ